MGSAIFDRRLRARAHSAGLSGAAAARSLCLCQGGKLALYGEEDVRCRAATVGNSVNAIIPIKRPSDDVVQTAPVKCRYTESGICANIAGFCLCTQANFALPRKQSNGVGAEQGNICRGGSVGALPNA